MKKIVLISPIILLSIFVIGLVSLQTNQTSELMSNAILFENNQIKFETKLVEFKEPNRSVINNFLVFTVTNKTDENIKVTYEKEAFYNEKCYSCGSSEAQFTIILGENEIKTGDCSNRNDKSLKTFHSFKTGESNSILTNLILKNVKIIKI